ncbi:elongation factor P maturation arginine rhamnosyltransferase EarP [Ramlibacter alkalitolerans]|uniref:Protein-arginine rhamnosyltransferase n=1 Tax=Ramlibacter alkalitolerans TaxID=2039631 RepID=A0ABS1JVE1_9BURK|nr:elongation factor P maturation arginine rhamnosyltransferase EarP [Ramlibacter alkalitolerans]MBL0428081.1 elongation factor P maturation arginine rhamnosyltransferase EarP [Ramlibacter alkalitolerans]
MPPIIEAVRWDIFCKVIDNHGDAGVCWRLAAELAARGHAVRLWMDDSAMLAWMAPDGAPGVEVVPWCDPVPDLAPGDVVIEAFGCDPPAAFVARMAALSTPPAWLNLEYLSAERYVERSHGLPSPVMHGPGAGLVKRFFYPGFTARTGGLLREQDLAARQASFDRSAWLQRWGIAPAQARVVSLFCYEPAALPQLLDQLAQAAPPTELLVTSGRAAAAVRRHALQGRGALRLHFLPLLSQREYDHLLWSCDLNFVRGEDSAVRGLLAGVPAIWQIYPQDDQAHHAKLEAFLDWLQPPNDLRDFFRTWNGVVDEPLPALDIPRWRPTARVAFDRAQALPELASGLVRFAGERGRI